MTIHDWLHEAKDRLTEAGIPSAQLDAELLLADALGKNRIWLIANPAADISDNIVPSLTDHLSRRLDREPLAYIRGYKEFYEREFTVTRETLIPRPETETMIELLAPLVKKDARLIDVGTGSGAIAITAQLEFPDIHVEACDVSEAALSIAKDNAKKLAADVGFFCSDLLQNTSEQFDIICANLPYVDASWSVSEETHFEPDIALFAEHGGLELIYTLIEQAETRLKPQGYLLLEADPRQHDDIMSYAHSHGLDWYETRGFIVVLQRR